MSSEPEQTKAPLIDRVLGRAYAHKAKGNQFDANLLFEVADTLTIQRAFEERERKLREALKPFARVADQEERTPSGSSILVNVDRCRDARQALKETPDAG